MMTEIYGITNFDQVRNYILGALLIVIVFSLGYAYLKPHRVHNRYPVSTLILKTTYLAYLLVLLVVVYFASLRKGGLTNVFYDIEFFGFLLVLFVPTVGIFIRKLGHFRKSRENFYYFFSLVNILSIAALLVMYFV
jgi:hypothetical protein